MAQIKSILAGNVHKRFMQYAALTSVIVVALWFSVHLLNDKRNCGIDAELSSIVDNASEVDTEILSTEDSCIIVAANISSKYELYRLQNKGFEPILSDPARDIFKPFLFDRKICGISDSMGNEEYHPTDPSLRQLIGNRPVDFIKSFFGSRYLVVKFGTTDGLFLYDQRTKTKHVVLNSIRNKLHDVVSGEIEKSLIISFDDVLCCYSLKGNKITMLAYELPGEKKTPFFFQGSVYFSNNGASEYQEIYKADVHSGKTALVYRTNHDLKMPKLCGGFLYFVESEQNEYKLKRTDFSHFVQLTTQGVVYNYAFLPRRQIAIVYSDLVTPRSIILYDVDRAQSQNMSDARTDLGISCEYSPPTSAHSAAYVLHPKKGQTLRGVILFFHPGLDSDFSPRWDSILMGMLHHGYIVVSPNFPMSAGFGKAYSNKSLQDAVYDVLSWQRMLKNKYGDLRLYLMSASSGNLLMEECLALDPTGISKAVSMFGLYARDINGLTVPTLLILGENDPKVNYERRSRMLRKESYFNASVISYEDEGHWFRKKKNLKDAISRISCFLQ